MESPVRICIGAALVVTLLLWSSTAVDASALRNITSNTTKDRAPPRYTKSNATTWRNKPKTPDVALNELNPKDAESEEHNAKYKDRGRLRFGSREQTSAAVARRRIRVSSEAPANKSSKLLIVTPEPETKNLTQIIDSMRVYKKTKLPVVATSSSTTPMNIIKKDGPDPEIEYEEEEEEEDDDSFEKFTSSLQDEDKFFSIPSFGDDDDDFTSDSKASSTKQNKNIRGPSYEKLTSSFPKPSSYSTKNKDGNHDSYKSPSYIHDFDSDLTTPKNEFFDKKFKQISSSIIKNLDSIKTKTSTPKTQVPKFIKENVSLEKSNITKPTNKSSVYYSTKELRLDNEGAGTHKQELSDVHGTSIYYEMSVMSTETYAIDNEEDCDDDETVETTVSTTVEAEQASVKTKTSKSASTKPPITASEKSIVVSSTSFSPTTSSQTTNWTVAQNSILSTEETVTSTKSSSSFRSRNFSKRFNFTRAQIPTRTTPVDQVASNQVYRPVTRRFHSTTPKTKPVWMTPRRNATRGYTRQPTTIYSEYFDIKDQFTTTLPRQPTKNILTTVASEIDPVLQSDIAGTKKVVSQSISDNSIPTLWKRGSTKFGTSTEAPSEESSNGDMEIPPTLTAWALASLISPPSMASPSNGTSSTHKNVDENELQKVSDIGGERNETTEKPETMPTTTASLELTSKTFIDIEQNKLQWRPVSSSNRESSTETTEVKSETVPAESNVSIKNNENVTTSEAPKTTPAFIKSNISAAEIIGLTNPPWIPMQSYNNVNSTDIRDNIALPPVTSTKSNRFQSITKFPSSVTTPQIDEIQPATPKQVVTSEINEVSATTDYDITTIRFSYVPIITTELSDNTESDVITTWHPVLATRPRIIPNDDTITTYRPTYMTTTDFMMEEDVTTTVPEIISDTVNTQEMVSTEAVSTMELTTDSTMFNEPSSEQVETTSMHIEVKTEISSNETPMTDITTNQPNEAETTTRQAHIVTDSDENINNEVVTQDQPETTRIPIVETTTVKVDPEVTPALTTKPTDVVAPTEETTVREAERDPSEVTTDYSTPSTRSVNELEDLTSYTEDVTTEASSRVLMSEEASSGAAVAIAVSTIGVIALIMLIGLLLVVRRRARSGGVIQRCTPVSLDDYSLDASGKGRLRASKRSYGNPAYDDEVTSHPMQYPALANFANNVESITAEFQEIPMVTVRPEDLPPGCEDKNRYSNILPLPETRVLLRRLGNDPTTEYINANYITGPGGIKNYYIACQAPLHNTVADLWRMVWEQNSRLIVMLTEYMENGVEKCYEYLPPSEISDNKRTFGDFQVILKKREQRDKYAVSTVQLFNLGTRTWREITHMWYFWPAKGVPDDYDSIIEFVLEMRGYMKLAQNEKEYDEEGAEVVYSDQRSSFHNLAKLRSEDSSPGLAGVHVYSPQRAEEQFRRANGNGTLGRMKAASEIDGVRPCVVTCASGSGRAAALVALDVSARALCAGAADVPRVVRQLRAQRSHALANRHHYIFLYKVLSEYGNKLMGGGIDTI